MDRSSKQKINKKTKILNNTLDEMDLIQDISSKCRRMHLLLKCTWNILQDHSLCHKSDLSKFKKIGIISSIFSDHNTMRLDINYKKNTVRNTNI